MMHRTPLTVRLDTFQGPLDLLLYLIQSNELDISKISISKITDQYLKYVQLMQTLNFDVASEFLVMAATLILWKSKALLPEEVNKNEENEFEAPLSQEDLVRQLLELQRFQKAGNELAQLPLLGEDVFTRQNPKPPIEKIWADTFKETNLTDLTLSYQDIILRSKKRVKILKKETVSLTQKILEFSQRLNLGQIIELRQLMGDPTSWPEVVVTFLAALELSRLRKLKLYQQKAYETIYLELVEHLKNFELGLATGFEERI